MQKYAIEVNDLCVNYRCIKSFSVKKSFLKLKRNKVEVHEAVKNVSFQIPKGEIMGIVGKNGSGKSTLLRTIAGIFSADSGKVNLHGNTISLLAIGVGFQKALTGRENIYLSGMLLGFSRKDIEDKVQEIIEFAGIGKFIDMPVKTYSSGMYSKLAFSITAILETDIMLIDEVLSVGDARFKKKSFKKMEELIFDNNRTVVIVSHSSETIRKLCNKVMWLHDGEIKRIGSTDKVMDEYDQFMA